MREGVEGGGLVREERLAASRCEEEVGVELEAALGDDVGLEGADGAGGGVARVGGGRHAGGDALLVHLVEGGLREDDFAADFEALRQAGGFQLRGGDVSGTERMVRTLEVTSSPMVPSPRVRPRRRTRCRRRLPAT